MVMLVMTPLLLAASWADGGLSLDEVDDVVAFHAPELTPCLKGRATGEVVLQLGLSALGSVSWNAVLSDTKPPRAVCASKVMRGWSFPARPVGTRLQWALGPRPAAAPLVMEGVDAGWGTVEVEAAAQVDAVVRCASQTLSSKEQSGPVSVSVVLGPSGAVLEAKPFPVPLRLEETGVEQCVAEHLRTLRFGQSQSFRRGTLEWLIGPSSVELIAGFASAPPPVDRPAPLQNAFDRALLRQARRLASCQGDAGAEVDVTLEVDDTGRITTATLADDAPAAACLRDRLLEVRLPAGTPPRLERRLRFTRVDVTVLPVAVLPSGLERDVIMQVIRAHQHEVKFCYEKALQEKPRLGGKVAMAWTIGPDGRVASASIEDDTVPDPSVARCVRDRVLTWVFPPPEGGGLVNVTFPWLFNAAGVQ
jgi:hypothetical protein